MISVLSCDDMTVTVLALRELTGWRKGTGKIVNDEAGLDGVGGGTREGL